MTAPAHRHFFSAVFCLTGVGTALLGATLPAILQHGHLTDRRGGLLLLAAWGGSTAGALFVRRRTSLSAATGLALASAGLSSLVSAAAPLLPVFYALFGLGLGITMTSISVMRATEVEASQADLALNRLNLLWAVGAFCAPALAFHSLRLLSVSSLFRVLGTVLAAASLVALFATISSPAVETKPNERGNDTIAVLPTTWAPLRLCLFAATAVGLESAIGSWLTTYAERATLGVVGAVSANSAFWAGLLLSRAMHSVAFARRLHTRSARIAHLAATGIAIACLILFPSRGFLPAAGLLCGLGLGPLYPWVLSIALPRFRSTAIFVLAGVGASLTPWLTGTLSSAAASLRIGLLAPALTFLFLIAVAYRMREDLR